MSTLSKLNSPRPSSENIVSINSEPAKKALTNALGKAGDDEQHRVAKDVAVKHLPLGAAFGARGEDVLLAQFLQKRVLGQERHGGKGGKPHGDDRQRQVPEIVEILCHQVNCSQPSEVSPRSGKMLKNEPPANRMMSRIANRNPGMA